MIRIIDGKECKSIGFGQYYVSKYRARVLKKGIGSLNGNSKLTKKDIFHIRKLHKEGMALNKIAKMKNMGTSQICRIVRKIHWNHV